MKKSSFLALAAAPLLLGVPMALQADSVATDPVGFVKTSLPAGSLTAVGVNLNKPAALGAAVESASADSISVSSAANVSDALDSAKSYYVEVTSGALEGDRIDVDVAGSSDATIKLNVASANNTINSAAALAAGDTVVVREHYTFSDITALIGEDNIHSGDDIGDTTQILTYEGDGFEFYAYFAGVWYQASTFDVVDDQVIAPGVGLMIQNAGSSDIDLTAVGEVRTNDFVLPLAAGSQLVTFGFPVDRSPADYGLTTDYFTAAELDASEGDQILNWDGSGFDFHALFSDGEWYNTGTFASGTNEKLFEAGHSVILSLHSGDEDFRINRPF